MVHDASLARGSAHWRPVALGGEGKTVEIDETIIGRQEGSPPRKGMSGVQFRNTVLTLVERGGAARSWHIDGTSIGTLIPIIRDNVARDTAVMTDSASWYKFLNRDGAFASHHRVEHTQDEYVRRALFCAGAEICPKTAFLKRP